MNKHISNIQHDIKHITPPDGHGGAKYIIDVFKHYCQQEAIVNTINPKSSSRVFEIGVGPGFLSYALQHNFNCKTSGLDIEDAFYGKIRNKLGISDVYIERVEKQRAIRSMNSHYDLIVGHAISFTRGWEVDDYIYLIDNCLWCLTYGGDLWLEFNADKCDCMEEVATHYDGVEEVNPYRIWIKKDP